MTDILNSIDPWDHGDNIGFGNIVDMHMHTGNPSYGVRDTRGFVR